MAKITDYKPLSKNPNKGTQKGVGVLDKSVRELGAGRSLLVDKDGIIIAGNHAQEAFVNAGLENVIEVETDGTQIVVVKRTDMSADSIQGKKMAIMDNRASELGLDWDAVVLEEMMEDIKAQEGELDYILEAMEEKHEQPEETSEGEQEFFEEDSTPMVERPDAVFLSTNEYEIPDLPLSAQMKFVEPPIVRWGRFARHKKAEYVSIYHFYTEDYKFSALWSDPFPVIASGCKAIIEPNISLCEEHPLAVGLWAAYRKRWISRYVSLSGIKIVVDMNVPQKFDTINLLGVPSGWKAYATRHYTEFGVAELERQYCLAVDRAGGEEDIIFMVSGGGKNIAEVCKQNGWYHIPLITEVENG